VTKKYNIFNLLNKEKLDWNKSRLGLSLYSTTTTEHVWTRRYIIGRKWSLKVEKL